MKNLFRSSIALCALAFMAAAATASPRTVKLQVENVGCVTCAPIVKRTLARQPGVSQVAVVERDGSATATVTFDDAKVTADALANATAGAGFPARVVEN